MKINKEFVLIVLEKRMGSVNEVIRSMNILKFEKNNQNKILNLHLKCEELERIFYTYDFLIKEKLINQYKIDEEGFYSYERLDFNPSTFEIFGKNIYERMEFTNGLLQEYWNTEFKINLSLFDFVDNNFRTTTQKKEDKNFQLAVIVALATTAVTLLGYIINLFVKFWETPTTH